LFGNLYLVPALAEKDVTKPLSFLKTFKYFTGVVTGFHKAPKIEVAFDEYPFN